MSKKKGNPFKEFHPSNPSPSLWSWGIWVEPSSIFVIHRREGSRVNMPLSKEADCEWAEEGRVTFRASQRHSPTGPCTHGVSHRRRGLPRTPQRIPPPPSPVPAACRGGQRVCLSSSAGEGTIQPTITNHHHHTTTTTPGRLVQSQGWEPPPPRMRITLPKLKNECAPPLPAAIFYLPDLCKF